MARRGVGQGAAELRALARSWSRVIKAEGKGMARHLIEDPVVLETMRSKLRAGKLHPQIQVMLWQYAYGKPTETVDVRAAVAVRIVHEFAPEPTPEASDPTIRVNDPIPTPSVRLIPEALPPHE